MANNLMIKEYNCGPKAMAARPDYKLWTFQESQRAGVRHNWLWLAVVLALIGGLSGYALRIVNDYNMTSTALAARMDWVADVGGDIFALVMTAVGVVLGVLLAYILRDKYARSEHCWSWFTSGAILPMGTFLAAPVVVWAVAAVVTLIGIGIGLLIVYFIWNMIFG